MKHLITLLLLAAAALALPAQSPTADRWTAHLSYHTATQCIRHGDRLYALFDGNLLICNTQTGEVTPIDRVSHGLSGRRIVQMGWSATQQMLVLLYADRGIDLFLPQSGQVVHLPQLKREASADLAINDLSVSGDEACIATSGGVVRIDLKQRLVRGFYQLGACRSATVFDGHIFVALTAGSTLVAPLTANLNDRAEWQPHTQFPATRLLPTDGALYLLVMRDAPAHHGVWMVLPAAAATDAYTARHVGAYALTGGHVDAGGTLIAESDAALYRYQGADGTPYVIRKDAGGYAFEPDGTDGLWVGMEGRGLFRTPIVEGRIDLTRATTTYGGFGPRQDRAYFMTYAGGELLVTTGRNDPYEVDRVPQVAMRYDGRNWTLFAPPGTTSFQPMGSLFESATSIARDPRRPQHYVVSTVRTGIYDYDTPATITAQATAGNSPFHSLLPASSPHFYNYVRTDGVNFDDQGNLFALNNQQDTLIWARKPDGKWTGLYHEGVKRAPGLERTLFDRYGQLWVTSRRTVTNHNGGFLCYDYNRTLDNTADDRATYRSSFVNQDGTAVNILSAYAIAQDHAGSLWLGTDQGLFKVDDPQQWHERNFLITQVKVPRNDGTNLADYLLSGVPVTAIAIDGADRKWVGTQGDGLYLISADGLQTLHHFTTDNSPLFSNNIWSVACHPTSGEVMVGTQEGILAYRSDATEPQPALERSRLRVFPNPVRPDYTGSITLDGLTADSEVKVTNTAGTVVAAGTSLGGTFTWDGRGFDGVRVASGVYHFHVFDPSGQRAAVAKVAIVR